MPILFDTSQTMSNFKQKIPFKQTAMQKYKRKYNDNTYAWLELVLIQHTVKHT